MRNTFVGSILMMFVLTGLTMAASVPGTLGTTAPPAPGWTGEVSTAITSLLALALAWLTKALAQAVAQIVAGLMERIGLRADADKQAALASFIEEHVRAIEERALAGKVQAAGDLGAEKLRQVTLSVRAKFPTLTDAHIDTAIHATLQRLPGFGATGPKPEVTPAEK